ncbi:hypothetical protein E5163_04845 [Marinicauda algicola]|uniref:Uncharacterized protein n=1 Tax=Marinicauda algicola TaxID=2029849 RepID=A0A4V3RYH6_9PROT|nr:hypothetical protein [Marinicauda algicola]TGY90449.1 hypothetical protein E5163_04845 [Marinicauda algicola]
MAITAANSRPARRAEPGTNDLEGAQIGVETSDHVLLSRKHFQGALAGRTPCPADRPGGRELTLAAICHGASPHRAEAARGERWKAVALQAKAASGYIEYIHRLHIYPSAPTR